MEIETTHNRGVAAPVVDLTPRDEYTAAVRAEHGRIRSLVSLARACKAPDGALDQAIDEGFSVEKARSFFIDRVAEDSPARQITNLPTIDLTSGLRAATLPAWKHEISAASAGRHRRRCGVGPYS
jgi:hypothetical protein